ncbi:MAG TPA: pitrilysin family protein [Gemmatimonadaceae bacterium]|nr:pitrilysin family protein [Gemmatimonadaceae bacterium]
MTRIFHPVVAALASLTLVAPISAQQKAVQSGNTSKSTLDRTKIPTAAKAADLRVPSWTKATLADGAELVVSEKHDLPLVSFSINFVGGAAQYEPAGKTGLGSIVGQMLTEGTTHRTGDQISNDLQLLGTGIGAGVGSESGRVGFTSTADKFEKTLAILADVLENPSFPQEALDRLKGRLNVQLLQNRDRTTGIAGVVFPKVLYTTDHPYGVSLTPETLASITRDDVASFYKSYFQPGRAIITVVGDITPAAAKAAVDRELAGWASGGSMPKFTYPAVPASKPTTIYLVDKPGAAQSTFAIGAPGPARDTPDYYAIRVMNEMLGVLFQSRLNHNIREVKGYSYGVFSNFAFGKGPGAFRAGGDIVTAKSDSALIEFMKELRDIRGPRPPTDDELKQAKASLVQSLPENFASVNGINASIGQLYVQGLPQDYYQQFARAVNAVTADDVVRVAKTYIDPDHLAIVIVGDRTKIEAPLAATNIAPIVHLDVNGNVVDR